MTAQNVPGHDQEKKVKTVKEVRDRRITALREDIVYCKQTISLLEQQRSKLVTAEKFIQAAAFVDQVKNKRKHMRDLELELGKLEKAEARSAKYHKEKQKKKKKKAFGNQKLMFSIPDAKTNNQSTASVIQDPESSPGIDDPDQNTPMEVQELPSNPDQSLNLSCESRPRVECDASEQITDIPPVRSTMTQAKTQSQSFHQAPQ